MARKIIELDSVPSREGDPPPITDWVFLLVYGTLRKGMSHHNVLEQPNVEYIDTIILPNYSLLNLGNVPTIVHARNNIKGVTCEMYKLPFTILQHIDTLVDCPEVFTRTAVPDTPQCFVYTMKMHEAFARKTQKIDWIHDGDYVKYINFTEDEQSVKDVEED